MSSNNKPTKKYDRPPPSSTSSNAAKIETNTAAQAQPRTRTSNYDNMIAKKIARYSKEVQAPVFEREDYERRPRGSYVAVDSNGNMVQDDNDNKGDTDEKRISRRSRHATVSSRDDVTEPVVVVPLKDDVEGRGASAAAADDDDERKMSTADDAANERETSIADVQLTENDTLNPTAPPPPSQQQLASLPADWSNDAIVHVAIATPVDDVDHSLPPPPYHPGAYKAGDNYHLEMEKVDGTGGGVPPSQRRRANPFHDKRVIVVCVLLLMGIVGLSTILVCTHTHFCTPPTPQSSGSHKAPHGGTKGDDDHGTANSSLTELPSASSSVRRVTVAPTLRVITRVTPRPTRWPTPMPVTPLPTRRPTRSPLASESTPVPNNSPTLSPTTRRPTALPPSPTIDPPSPPRPTFPPVKRPTFPPLERPTAPSPPIAPSSPSPALPVSARPCEGWCDSNPNPWVAAPGEKQKCNYMNTCAGCDPCVEERAKYPCLESCDTENGNVPWVASPGENQKCVWKEKCYGCPECF
eukprot:CAMPEP_0172520404 /NCGR_PEP_ID=MMETSP1066-20121228/291982_1 /TAXON_ID=671091 /ORGANISM="Coscinodiscus wailesii, Strain CCMP2513" /LENGTH=522 /DNA_ID=CAMNT_0013303153 /DNA_START=116 /DNA_END=1684 /DNA_ORIENTATION=-